MHWYILQLLRDILYSLMQLLMKQNSLEHNFLLFLKL